MNAPDQQNKFTTDDKLQYEVEKLREEIRNFKKPFLQNPTNLIALTTVTIAIGTIFFNIRNGILENKSAKIENSELKIEKRKLQSEKDSINKVKELLVIETSKQNIIKTTLKKEIDSIFSVLNNIRKTNSEKEKIMLTEKLTNKLSRSIFQKNSANQIEIAIKKEKEGFNHLINGKFDLALLSFIESENAYNGYKISYELAKLLMKNKEATEGNNLVQKKVLQEIVSKYKNYIPDPYKNQILNLAK